MKPRSSTPETPSERLVRDIRRATRKQYSAEEKIRIVLDGLRGDATIASECWPAEHCGIGPTSEVACVIPSIRLSTWREPGDAKGRGIGFNLRHITATELGLEPFGNGEIRAGYQELFCGSSGLL